MYMFNVAIELHADFCGGFYKRLNSVLLNSTVFLTGYQLVKLLHVCLTASLISLKRQQ